MKHTTWIGAALALGLALGCGKSDDKGATGGGKPPRKMGLQTGQDCERLGAKMTEVAMKDTPAGMSDEQKVALRKLSEEAGQAIARHCKDDGWSGEAVACGMSATDPSKECNDKLTAEQKQKMQDEVQAIFEKGMAAVMGAAPPAPPVPPPPSTEPPPAAPPTP